MRKTSFVALALFVLAPLAAVRAEDDDPEPPGSGAAEYRKLKGKWTIFRRFFGGKELTSSSKLTYTFDGDKLTIDSFKASTSKVKVLGKKKPYVLELTREGFPTPSKMAFEIRKGELYLALMPAKGKGDDKPDFSGQKNPLLILEREDK